MANQKNQQSNADQTTDVEDNGWSCGYERFYR